MHYNMIVSYKDISAHYQRHISSTGSAKHSKLMEMSVLKSGITRARNSIYYIIMYELANLQVSIMEHCNLNIKCMPSWVEEKATIYDYMGTMRSRNTGPPLINHNMKNKSWGWSSQLYSSSYPHHLKSNEKEKCYSLVVVWC